MFVMLIRKYIGGLRFFLSMLVLLIGAGVVTAEIFGAKLSIGAYSLIGGMFVQAVAFTALETKRKTGAAQ